MEFNSLIFIIFILIFSIISIFIKKDNSKYLFISIASLIFYGYWDWTYIFLILISGLIDFICGQLIYQHESKRKYYLVISILSNLSLLFVFKYFEFFVQTINQMMTVFSIDSQINFKKTGYFAVLPVGISFYTFQSMSYTLDIYRRELKPTRNFLKFFSYLSFFPQLVAGPIVRAQEILNQMNHLNLQRNKELFVGIRLITLGFFKKVVIADNLASYVNAGFANPSYPDSSLYWWTVMICFAIQIYCDFSGYSDIAIGIAKSFGINFPRNFNHPYTATSFKDFWGRWHISLSTWFRDYVYIPLGGSRVSVFRSHVNMWITMCLSGLWHGANFTFIVWGALHSLFLSIERLKFYKIDKVKVLNKVFMLIGVLTAWVYFRAVDITQANNIVYKMFAFSGSQVSTGNSLAMIVLAFLIIEYLYKNEIFSKSKLQQFEPYFLGLLMALSIYCRGDGDTFIYFQF